MKSKYTILILFGSFFISNVLWGQLDPRKINHFDGLEGTTIYDITADHMGNLWIGTQSGLVKFDGYEYIRFHPDPSDTTTMGELLAYSLHCDDNGDVWIGSQSSVYRYNTAYKSFTRFRYDSLINVEDFPNAGIGTIVSDGRGRTYFGIHSYEGWWGNHALIYMDQDTSELKSFPYPDSLNLAGVYRSTVDPAGNVWFLDYTGAYKIDTNYKLVKIEKLDDLKIPEDEWLSGILADSSGSIWFSTMASRLIQYQPEKPTRLYTIPLVQNESMLAQQWLVDLIQDEEKNIWFTTRYGINRFDTEKKTFDGFENKQDIISLLNPTRGLYQDVSGNIWFGINNLGLYNYRSKILLNSLIWNDIDPTTITSGWVLKIWETEEGKLWIATRGNGATSGISEINLTTGEVTPYTYSQVALDYPFPEILMKISPNEILIETPGANYKVLNLKTWQSRDTSFSFLPDTLSVKYMFNDSHGITWFCGYTGLVAHHGKENRTEYIDLTSLPGTFPASNDVARVVKSNRYGLWILTNHGLFLYNYETEEITRKAWDGSNGGSVLSSQDINSFYEDPEGVLWIGTWQGGLNRYDPRTGEIKVYSIRDGLTSSSIQGILADEKNDALWLSTFQGISRFSITDEQFNNFSLADGMQGLLYADFQYFKTSGNIFVFGGSNGLTYFNPEDISENSPPPQVYITGFKVADKTMPIDQKNIHKSQQGDPFVLVHDQNNISFEYTGIQFDNPPKNRFAYILENYDDSWRQVGNLRAAFYYNLPPGNYTFKVKAANSNGVWSDDDVSLSFVINPPWWQTWWAYVLYALILISAIVAVDKIQRKRLLEKERKQAREKELAHAKEIEKAYNDLKETQKQLIHSEKMASLGELTAGIAHEIQNPLNFMNNFSEVNTELIDELKEELQNGNLDEVKAIADDLADNEGKISHHGKRADGIVKGMLQHSRIGSGQKEPTDLNALADEYLRLSYHGLRAKDKNFNADFHLEADENLPKINVVPQDLGRVLLNLINNAFHAVKQHAETVRTGHALSDQRQVLSPQEKSYKPIVTITTKILQDKVEIRVRDNGPGIPEEIRDKIFQPFFTTKPTGEGTGLGLSLSYDIITKGHGGDIQVESNTSVGLTAGRAGTVFIIVLPLK